MSIVATLTRLFRPEAQAAAQLPLQALPKVRPKQQSYPSYAKSITPSTARVPQTDLRLANTDITQTGRNFASTPEVLRNLVRATPDLAAAVSSHLRLGIPDKHLAIAQNPDGTFNLEATSLAMELLRRWSRSPNYETGFSQTDSLRSLSEALGKELVMYGAACLELVLDKQRLPNELNPISITTIKFYEDGKGLRPIQLIAGQEVDLDLPTVMYVTTDADLLDPYAQSPIESAIQAVLASGQFLNDLRRICQRSVYPRMVVDIDAEKLRLEVPAEVAADPDKLNDYLNNVKDEVESMVNSLNPEDAIVKYSFVTCTYMQSSGDVPDTFKTVKEIHDAKIATGAKTLPSLIGHGTGSQNSASTETVIAMLTANSLVRVKLQELYSRALTLAVRLYGIEATVGFEFDEINLRPAAELEAFTVMRQSRLLELLSYGYITDEEFCLRMTGNLPPAGIKLSGTQFKTQPADASGNPYSGAPQGGGQSGGGAANQSRKSQTPEQAKGPAK
jgi:hypothetical protein